MYVYSPILFDSQVVSELFSTRTSTPGDVPCAADSIYLLLVGLWQWNGEWRASLVQQVTLQLTRIHDACRKGRFPPMEWRGITVSCPRSCGSIITMPLGLGLAMEMENGEDVRGSLPSLLVPQEAPPCIGVVFGD